MKPVRVLLIDKNSRQKKLLENRNLDTDSIKFVVTLSGTRNAEVCFKNSAEQLDIILLGKTLSQSAVVQLTKNLRSINAVIPIFVLTSGVSQLPRNFRHAGVDDFINVEEISTPLFFWTFISTVEHSIVRKKAKEYDVLQDRLKRVCEMLAAVMHDINNPLSVIRLALYHLANPDLPKSKRETFLKFLVENVDRVDSHMKDLRTIRRQLGEETSTRAKILSMKPSARTAALR